MNPATATASPLSAGQQALWLDESLRGESAVYNVPVAYEIHGELDTTALAAALTSLVGRHPALRGIVGEDAGRPGRPAVLTATADGAPVPLDVRDLGHLPPGEARARAADEAREFAAEPLSLSRLPLLRALLLRTAAQDALLVLVVHHGCFDSWSVDVLREELAAGYDAALAGNPLPAEDLPAYAEHRAPAEAGNPAEDPAEDLAEDPAGSIAEDLAHWRTRLAGTPAESTWPHDRTRPEHPTQQGAVTGFTVPGPLAGRLRALARKQRTTPFALFTAALQLLLARVAQDTDAEDAAVDVAIGTPVARREHAAAEQLIGYLANTVVLRRRIDPAESFTGLLARTGRELRTDLAHSALPFPAVVRELAPVRSPGRSPFFQVMLVVEDAPQADLRLGTATGHPVRLHSGTAKFDLTLTLEPEGSGYRGTLEYATDAYTPATAEEITRALLALLQGVAADPDAAVGTVPVTAARPAPGFAAAQAAAARELPLSHVLFDRTADRVPEAPALRWDGGELSYARLRQAADRLARRIGTHRAVALCAHRSPELAVALLAVLKSGAGYVPLDPAYPRERLDYMLADSGAGLLLVHSDAAEGLTVPDGVKVLPLDDVLRDLDSPEPAGLPQPAGLPEPRPAGSGDLGYVIYTSGSTGLPKGVEMPHAPLANLIDWQLARSAAQEGWNTLQFAAFSFDVAFQEHFSTWASGGTLVLVDEDVRRDPARLLAHIDEQRVHRVFAPFVALQQLADAAAETGRYPESLREVVTAGEQLQVTDALRTFFERVPAFLENQYGPSETHVVTAERLTGPPATWPDLPAIGLAVDRTAVEVLDDRQQPLPAGVPGEICVSGAALADGYRGKPDMTAERFTVRDGRRLYRTGDFGRILSDGRIQCLGRRDGQVKVRGYRMELGEIEAQVRRQEGVADAVVVVDDVPGRGKRLIAHCLPAAGAGLSPQRLRRALRGVLPDYMLPAAYVVVDGFPLTPSGKVDRKTLAARPLPGATGAGPVAAARDAVEFEMCDLWATALGRESVGIDEDFFALGGDSLTAVRLMASVRAHFATGLELVELFRAPTVAELARRVRDGGDGADGEAAGPLVRLQAGDGTAPLYLFPPLAGTVVRYAPVARALGGGRTVYGLQSPGLQPGEDHCDTIADMARVYVEQMRKVHPGGPWHVGGYSMGGVIAFEAARQLKEAGEEIGLVALLDTNPRMDLDPAEDYATRILVTMGLKLDLDLEALAALPEPERIRLLLEQGIATGALPADYDEDRLVRMLAAYRRNGSALERHTIERFDGEAVLFRAEDRSADVTEEPYDLGWGDRCARLTVRDTPGTHFTMLDSGGPLETLCALVDTELEARR
ncbi:amino acid adenylation domain-containing protein [Streptomyces sp. NPDC048603]|uniref:non-ribosomal peptide synthetase n=1 Tax=Streptomyces sp. NPDC048603 TaxID=3365577 RepID=UPI00372241F4